MTVGLDRSLMESIITSWVGSHGPSRFGLDATSTVSLMLNDAISSDLVIHRKEEGSGSLIWCKVADWDSEMLGVRVGRLSFISSNDHPAFRSRSNIVSSLVKSASDRFDLLIGRLDSRDVSNLNALENAGFRTADSLVTLVNDSVLGHRSSRVRLYIPSDKTYLEEIGRVSFRTDHYHADPRLSSALCDNLYVQWVRNSCDGRATAIFVVEDDCEPSGFITCLLNTEMTTGRKIGVIDLVAVSPSKQGRGLGVKLVSSALSWFREQGAAHVEVGTQVSNIQAIRLYQHLGFQAFRSVYTVHGWSTVLAC